MFGIYRTLLALLVVLNHLGGVWEIGRWAVFGFFILSGYLMTLILQGSYGYSIMGLRRYAVNRFLRIYPTYWVILILTLILSLWQGARLTAFHEVIAIPSGTGWLSNIALFLFRDTVPRFMPQAWALTVEVIWYGLIALGLSKNVKITWIWFAAAICYTVTINLMGLGWEWKYFHIAAGALPFSTGALIFHYRNTINKIVGKIGNLKMALLMTCLLAANYAGFRTISRLPGELFFYASYFIQTFMIMSLIGMSVSKRVFAIDKLIGELSYPVYLSHYVVGFTVYYFFPQFGGLKNLSLFFASIVPLLLLSWLIVITIDRPIEKLRARIKRNAPQKNI
jgi:peptidoglycan/LPS O-acetylase OafA/YrhL